MPVRRGALSPRERALRRRLVPLPHLPAQQRRAGDGVRQRRGRRLADRARRAAAGASRATSGIACPAATCGTPLAMRVDHQPETVDFSIATLDDPGRDRARLPHLLGKQGGVVRAGRRSAAPCAVQARHARARRDRTAGDVRVGASVGRRARSSRDASVSNSPSSHCWMFERGAAPTFCATGCATLEQQHRRDAAHAIFARACRDFRRC